MGKINAIILSDKRTGSTFLYDVLGSHPNITAYGELFMLSTSASQTRGQVLYKTKRKREKWSKSKYLDWLFSPENTIVFKLIYNQMYRWNLLSELKRRKVRIIHLVRRDALARAVSGYTKNIYTPTIIKASPEELMNDVKRNRDNVKKTREALKGYPYTMEVAYEDIIGEVKGNRNNVSKLGAFNIKSDQVTYLKEEHGKAICDFLELPYHKMWSNVTKKNQGTKWDYIGKKNKRKVKQLFKKNGLGKYLEG